MCFAVPGTGQATAALNTCARPGVGDAPLRVNGVDRSVIAPDYLSR